MISAVVLINVQRNQINETAQSLLEIEGVAEVYSVTGETTSSPSCASTNTKTWPRSLRPAWCSSPRLRRRIR